MHKVSRTMGLLGHALAETIWPTRCVSCEMPGGLLCKSCRDALERERIDLHCACPICGAPFGGLVCTQCTPASEEEIAHADSASFAFSQARAAVSFEGVGKALVKAYKDGGEQRLDTILATLLANTLQGAVPRSKAQCATTTRDAEVHLVSQQRPPDIVCHEVENWIPWCDALAFVPARKDAVRRRGFDHMQRIARLVSRWTDLPLLEALSHVRPVLDQRLLSDVERMDNLAGSMAAVKGAGTLPAHIIVMDDVFTTGATLSAAASALLEAGAEEVRAVAVALVW